MRRIRRLAVALVVAGIGLAGDAHAQWGVGSDGVPTYAFDFRTTGTFTCFGTLSLNSCNASGNQATITRGGASLQLDFSGVSVHAQVGDQNVPLGNLTTFVSGGVPFSPNFPGTTRFGPILVFDLLIEATAPGVASRRMSAVLEMQETGIRLASYGLVFGYVQLPTFGLPDCRCAPNVVVIENTSALDLPYTSASTPLTARIGIVPEPSTYALFGTGLLGLAGIARRKRAAS